MNETIFYGAIGGIGFTFLICIFLILAFRRDKIELNKDLNDKNLELNEISQNFEILTAERNELIRLSSEQRVKLESNEESINELSENLKTLSARLDQKNIDEDELESYINDLKQNIGTAEERAKNYEIHAQSLQASLSQKEQEIRALNERENALNQKLTLMQSELKAKEQNLQMQEENLAQVKKSLNLEFENLANKIFEEKTNSFNKTNQTSLELLLKPLREQIATFQNRVNEVHNEAVKNSVSLESEIKQVLNIGLNMSKEAQNLATALKGNNKISGNWGEAQLERTLEAAGLIKNEHYFTQQNFTSENGARAIPDFIIKLPDDKHIIIDSKVSLLAYDEAVRASDEAKFNVALSEHIRSVRKHIDELAKKDYSSLESIKSPDFVLMFMPIEPAYIEAMKFDGALFNYGYERKVVLVSHTTLMPILRTVANLWRIEQGNQEAQQIAARAGEIYNKVCNVAEALSRLGGTLNTASNHYNQAVTSFVGKGGLLGKIERFKQLSNKAVQNEPQIAEINAKFESERLEFLKEDGAQT